MLGAREMDIPYRHPETGESICPACYQRGRKGKKIEPKTGPVQNPTAARHPEIRHPGNLIGKKVMDKNSLKVGRIVGADFKEVEVDFNGVRERYNQGKLNDLVLFTEAAKDFREERLAAARKLRQVSEEAAVAKHSTAICQPSDLVAVEKVITESLSVANLILKGDENMAATDVVLKEEMKISEQELLGRGCNFLRPWSLTSKIFGTDTHFIYWNIETQIIWRILPKK